MSSEESEEDEEEAGGGQSDPGSSSKGHSDGKSSSEPESEAGGEQGGGKESEADDAEGEDAEGEDAESEGQGEEVEECQEEGEEEGEEEEENENEEEDAAVTAKAKSSPKVQATQAGEGTAAAIGARDLGKAARASAKKMESNVVVATAGAGSSGSDRGRAAPSPDIASQGSKRSSKASSRSKKSSRASKVSVASSEKEFPPPPRAPPRATVAAAAPNKAPVGAGGGGSGGAAGQLCDCWEAWTKDLARAVATLRTLPPPPTTPADVPSTFSRLAEAALAALAALATSYMEAKELRARCELYEREFKSREPSEQGQRAFKLLIQELPWVSTGAGSTLEQQEVVRLRERDVALTEQVAASRAQGHRLRQRDSTMEAQLRDLQRQLAKSTAHRRDADNAMGVGDQDDVQRETSDVVRRNIQLQRELKAARSELESMEQQRAERRVQAFEKSATKAMDQRVKQEFDTLRHEAQVAKNKFRMERDSQVTRLRVCLAETEEERSRVQRELHRAVAPAENLVTDLKLLLQRLEGAAPAPRPLLGRPSGRLVEARRARE